MMLQPELRTGYAERRRRGLYKSTLRVKVKSRSGHVA